MATKLMKVMMKVMMMMSDNDNESQIPKNSVLYVVCHDNSHHLLKYLFLYLLQCSVLLTLSNVSNLLQNGQFPIYSLFWRPILLPWQR